MNAILKYPQRTPKDVSQPRPLFNTHRPVPLTPEMLQPFINGVAFYTTTTETFAVGIDTITIVGDVIVIEHSKKAVPTKQRYKRKKNATGRLATPSLKSRTSIIFSHGKLNIRFTDETFILLEKGGHPTYTSIEGLVK